MPNLELLLPTSDFTLDFDKHEYYRILFIGRLISKVEKGYFREIVLIAYNLDKGSDESNIRYYDEISVDLSVFLIPNSIVSKKGIYKNHSKIKKHTFSKTAKEYEKNKFSAKFLTKNFENKPEILKEFWMQNYEDIPIVSIRAFQNIKNNYNKEDYIDYIIPCAEIMRYFFFCDVKTANMIISGEILNRIMQESRILVCDDGKKIGFVCIDHTQSEVTNKILAWISLSNLAYDAAYYIYRSSYSSLKDFSNSTIFPKTYFPTLDKLYLDVSITEINNSSRVKLVDEITKCSKTFFPVDEIIYQPYNDRRSIDDEELKSKLKEKSYNNYKGELDKKLSELDNLSGELPTSGSIPPIGVNRTGSTLSFFDSVEIPIRATEKLTQKNTYKGKIIVVPLGEKPLSTSDHKSKEFTEIEVHNLNYEGHKLKTIDDLSDFLKGIFKKITLNSNFKITILNNDTFTDFNPSLSFKIGHTYVFKIVYQEKYFYFIEKFVPQRYNRPWLFIYDPLFNEIKVVKIRFYLYKLKEKAFTWKNVQALVKDDGKLTHAFYREDDNSILDQGDMAEKIKNYIISCKKSNLV